jgi:hypothetical protein
MAQRMPLDQWIPRLRMAHLALPPVEDAMERQQHRILQVASLPGKDYDHIDEREALFLPGSNCGLTGVLLPIQSSPVGFWLLYPNHVAIAIHTTCLLQLLHLPLRIHR